MKAFVFSISFLLAFLLFSVQPMATKMVLPTLGGTPAVWNTAMLTFQLLLLAGYAYAHAVSQYVRAQRQWMVHAGLVLISLAFLPLSVTLISSDALILHPISHLAFAFVLQLGLPFFILSATAPLLQAWVSRSTHPLSKTPYVLYSASNLGSMAGLLGYIALIEPRLTLTQQSMGWSMLFVAGMLALLTAAVRLKPQDAARQEHSAAPPGWRAYGRWMWLAFLPSSLSLGVTSYITTDIASVPLIWVLPLAIYLLSFVDAFRERPWLVGTCMRMAPIIGLLGLLAYGMPGNPETVTFLFQLAVFAVLAFALHGWLARFKPAPAQLTRFYFCLSIGGALGGVLNAIVAPLVFNEAYEYPISLLLATITGFVLLRDKQSTARVRCRAFMQVGMTMALGFIALYALMSAAESKPVLHYSADRMLMAAMFSGLMAMLVHRQRVQLFYALLLVGTVMMIIAAADTSTKGLHFKERSFFGIWRVFDKPEENARYMMHNTTVHSVQFLKQEGPIRALSYYYPLYEAFDSLPVLAAHPAALLGLGAGTAKCLMQPGQAMDIFEIDPTVVRLAEDPQLFRYLSECPGEHKVFLGDGRLRLAEQPDNRYGAIVLDAFSSDSIPTHLMTLEALSMYIDKLAPGGVVLIHTTNRHIELWPLIAEQADALGVVAYGKHFTDDAGAKLTYKANWAVLAREDAALAALLQNEPGWQRLRADPDARPWTDNYTNMIPYFRILRD